MNDNNKNLNINSNIINKTENNIQYSKLNELYKENAVYNTKEKIDNKSYTLLNNKTNTPKKILNNSLNMSNINKNNIHIN